MNAPASPAPDYLAEAMEILRAPQVPFIITRDHLAALQAAVARVTQSAALMNRALIGTMLDSECFEICIPAGLVAQIEAQHLDLNLEYRRGAIVVSILRPHAGRTN